MTFEQKMKNYADLAVRVGVNVQPGGRLLVRAPVEAAPLVRLAVERAYEAGARFVDVLWDDDATTLARFQRAPRDSFEEVSAWRAEALNASSERGDALLSIRATDPDLLKDIDPALVAQTTRATLAGTRPQQARTMSNAVPWSIVAPAIPGWARRVFPDLEPGAAVARLWDAIFAATRADQSDPVGAWRAHLETLEATRGRLNAKRYAALRFNGPGTDLTVGLADGHRWLGGESRTGGGHAFVPNIPTEEVFTLPHRDRVTGTVSSTKPLAYSGTLLDGIQLRFEGGRVVEAKAARGEAVLRELLDTDEGARRLGEVALVPSSSPIARSGVLFYNTLFDENAASHVAVGRGYPVTLEGGETVSPEEYAARGGNDSLVHVDWMIGSPEVDVDGVRADGGSEAVMRKGEWAF